MNTDEVEAAVAAVPVSPPVAKGPTGEETLPSDSPESKRAKYQHRTGKETVEDSLGVPQKKPSLPTDRGEDETKVTDPANSSDAKPEDDDAAPSEVLRTCFKNVTFMDLFGS